MHGTGRGWPFQNLSEPGSGLCVVFEHPDDCLTEAKSVPELGTSVAESHKEQPFGLTARQRCHRIWSHLSSRSEISCRRQGDFSGSKDRRDFSAALGGHQVSFETGTARTNRGAGVELSRRRRAGIDAASSVNGLEFAPSRLSLAASPVPPFPLNSLTVSTPLKRRTAGDVALRVSLGHERGSH